MLQRKKIINGEALFDGKVYSHSINEWTVKWESKDCYRHWCIQTQDHRKHAILVVMQNPGSLSGNGDDLSKDTTLRILREVFKETEAYPVVLNLFDYAAAKQSGLFDNWFKRDSGKLIYDFLDITDFTGVIYAYGNCESHNLYGEDIKKRISLIRSLLNIREVQLPLNLNGTPKHPIIYQRQKIKPEITVRINDFISRTK